MPDLDDEYLRAALRDLRDSALPAIRPPRVEEVEHLARRRQSTNTAGLVSLAVLLIMAAIAIANITKDPLPVVPAPTSTPSPASPPATTTPATPGAGELADATIAMPFLLKQACPSTPLPYRGGTYEGDVPFQWFAHVTATARTDVDRDGVEEVIVRADCSVSDDTQNQIIALRPDGNGWATLGVVVEPTSAGPEAIQLVGDFAVTSAGEVVVSVATKSNTGAPWVPPPLWQQRTYGWTGQGFAQTAGPATFFADPGLASFTVTVPPVALTAGSGGFREGTLTVTVRADGPGGVEAGLMVVTSAERGPGGDWTRCGADSAVQWALCDLGVLAVGATRTFSLPIRIPADLYLGDGTIGMMVVRIDQFEYESVTINVANP